MYLIVVVQKQKWVVEKGKACVDTRNKDGEHTITMAIFNATEHKRNHDSVQPARDKWMSEQCVNLSSTTFNLQPLRKKNNILKKNKWQTFISRYLMSMRQRPQNVYEPGKQYLLSKISFTFSTLNSMVARERREIVSMKGWTSFACAT